MTVLLIVKHRFQSEPNFDVVEWIEYVMVVLDLGYTFWLITLAYNSVEVAIFAYVWVIFPSKMSCLLSINDPF